MTYQVLTALKVKTKQGETILYPGQIIDLNLSKAHSFIAQGKIKPMNLEETLDSILFNARDRIVNANDGSQYKANDEIRAVEDEINRLYKAVLNGQESLSDFPNACEKWVLICKESLSNRTQN